jgi:hypothetical protein
LLSVFEFSSPERKNLVRNTHLEDESSFEGNKTAVLRDVVVIKVDGINPG